MKEKQKRVSTPKDQDLNIRVVSGGEMSEADVDIVVSILANWWMRDFEKRSALPDVKIRTETSKSSQ